MPKAVGQSKEQSVAFSKWRRPNPADEGEHLSNYSSQLSALVGLLIDFTNHPRTVQNIVTTMKQDLNWSSSTSYNQNTRELIDWRDKSRFQQVSRDWDWETDHYPNGSSKWGNCCHLNGERNAKQTRQRECPIVTDQAGALHYSNPLVIAADDWRPDLCTWYQQALNKTDRANWSKMWFMEKPKVAARFYIRTNSGFCWCCWGCHELKKIYRKSYPSMNWLYSRC